ncbi:heavy metal translocating P-type ATPase, partial [filamentous cyanobacterium CCP1]
MSSDEERRALQLQQADNHNHDTDQDDDDDVEGFEGPWYAFPPIRNALIAGALLVTGWLVSQFQVPVYVPYSIFGLAILIG